MRNILITTDFSDNANHAIDFVLNLFQYESCKFHLLHVVKASSFISDDLMSLKPSSSLYSQIIADEKQRLDIEIERLSNQYNNILHEFTPIVDYDNLIGAIKQSVDNNNIELIVMGTKGATNSIKKIFGSNTLRVIENIELPVLAIPESCKIKPITKILFTTNLSRNYHHDDLKFLVGFSEHYNCEIHMLHVSEKASFTQEQERIKNQLDELFKNISHHLIDVSESSFLTSVIKYIEGNGIDMFAMVSRQHSFFEKLFNEQKIEKIANHLDVPFLALTDTQQ
ncbi:hypothetical protein C1T31_09870 [Hanstruepera neustonica]|uniref:UspA domain-containing protein n=1 Tax=Hanstruepera neustonica TaxID=1445657 RepID=A0A2K1DXR9_9FLAO|nr:universal stress protein [Hanstruepera neustonica]PNQ72807.1 hypothetical protein C1T31_09870 [Hanstruepera neustonica]